MALSSREMQEGEPQPEAEYTIDNLETLRVFLDPFRARIIELLWGQPKPVKQLAAELGNPVTKLYYHMKLLEQHNLVRVVGTHLISGIEEKQYQARAWFYPIAPALLAANQPGEGMEKILQQAFDETKHDVRRLFHKGVFDEQKRDQAGSLLLRKSGRYLTPEQAQRFYDKLAHLVAEFDSEPLPAASAEGQTYRILVSIYPIDEGTASEN
jgi:DNA-binding transcriptional ArsR family regulator